MNSIFLIIDIGTGNLRVGAVSAESGKILQIETCNTPYERDNNFADSSVFSPKQWKQTIRDLILKIMSTLGTPIIKGISASSQREGIVLIDKNGEAFLGIPNVDNRAAAYLSTIEHSQEITEITGFDLNPAFCGPKLFATIKAEPDIAARIDKFISISDWVGYLFTGRIVFEHAQAMHTLVYDHVNHRWDPHLCELFGLPFSWLPELAECGSILGTPSKEAKEFFSIEGNPLVVVGGADTQLALVGMQANLGDLCVISGTTTPVEKLLDTPVRLSAGWLNPHAILGQYMLEVNAAYTGLNYQRFKQMFFPEIPYSTLEEKALSRGLPKVTAMFSMGLAMPSPPVLNGGFLLPNPLPFDMDGVDFMHAIALDIACGIALACKASDELVPSNGPILCCGGGFQGKLMPFYLSALTNKPLYIFEGYTQASILGCVHFLFKALNQKQPDQKLERSIHSEPTNELLDFWDRWSRFRQVMYAANEF